MSKRLDVVEGVKALVIAALPGASVRGLTQDEEKPSRVGPGGYVGVRAGDPGEPEVDLSPLTYHYEHPIPLEIAAYESATLTTEQVLDGMMVAIGEAIEADRTLGGLCTFLEATAPSTDDFDDVGIEAGGWATLTVVAHYSTANPLT